MGERDSEVVGLALQAVVFAARGWVGVGGMASGDKLVVTGSELALAGRGERSVSGGSCLVTGGVDLDEETGEPGRPCLLGGDLGDRGEIA